MFYSPETIEEVRKYNNIIDVISDYMILKQHRDSYLGLCPFHKEHTPSFSVSYDKQLYHCFGCGSSGNVFTFIMNIEKISFIETLKFLAKRINYILPESNKDEYKKNKIHETISKINMAAGRYFYVNLSRTQCILDYLAERKISSNTRKIFGLGYAPKNSQQLYKYLISLKYSEDDLITSGLFYKNKFDQLFCNISGRLIFPIFDLHKKIIGFGGRALKNNVRAKYINSPKTPLFDKSSILFNLNLALCNKEKSLIIVEGYFDAITLYQAGFTNVVATLGTTFCQKQVNIIKKKVDKIILLFDNDEAGLKASLRTLNVLEAYEFDIYIAKFVGAKDPDEYIRKFGPDEFDNVLKKELINSTEFKLGLIKKKYPQTNIENKTKFLKEAAKVIFNIPNKIKRDLYIKKITNDAGISEETFKYEVLKYKNVIDSVKSLTHETKKKSIYTSNLPLEEMIKDLFCIMINNSQIISAVKKYLLPCELENRIYARLLEVIYFCYEQKSELSIAEVINNFTSSDDQSKVADTLVRSVSYNNINKAIEDIIKVIKKNNMDKKLRELLISDVKGSNAEQIKVLLSDKKNIEQLIIVI